MEDIVVESIFTDFELQLIKLIYAHENQHRATRRLLAGTDKAFLI